MEDEKKVNGQPGTEADTPSETEVRAEAPAAKAQRGWKATLGRVRAVMTKARIYLPLFFLILLFLDLLFRKLYWSANGLSAWTDKTAFLLSVCWCALLTGFALILPKIVKQIYMMLIILINCLFVLMHAGFNSFFYDFFSFSDIRFAGDGAAFFEPEYIHIRPALIWGVVLCVVLGIAACFFVPKKERYSVLRIVAAVLLLLAPIFGIQRVVKTSFAPGAINWNNYQYKGSIYEHFTDSRECLMMTGLYHYTFRDFCMSYGVYDIFTSDKETIRELDDYYAAITPDPDNEMTGIFKDKNLILIQLEAIDTWMINDTCMPNLSALQRESINFANHFAPVYLSAGTFNTENIANSGFISPFTGGAITIFSHNSYPLSAARLFRDAGYTANSFHGSPGRVYDREIVHTNWGYESYHSGADIGMSDYGWDSQLIAGYDKMTRADEKFFTFIITISGHGPYIDSAVSNRYYDRFAALLPEDTDPMVIHAHAHAYETDLFIGELIERMEQDGRIDDTVIAFYADHYDYYVLDNQIIKDQKGTEDDNLIQQTPFFIYAKGTPAREVTKVTFSPDVLPTLVNLFDLNTDGRYYVGNDAFSENGGYVFFADYSWYDGTQYWKPGDPADAEEIIARNEEIRERINASWNTMNTNYFFHRDPIDQ